MPHGQGRLTKSCFNFETKRAASDEKFFSNAEFSSGDRNFPRDSPLYSARHVTADGRIRRRGYPSATPDNST
jgi:hypothetical protein